VVSDTCALAGASGPQCTQTVFEEPDEDGWIVARVVEVPGALSQGRTREEARENLIDALRLMLTSDDDDPSVAGERTEPLDLTMVAFAL
jgi:predicted RNase H-like HicB family nuclease